MQLKYARVEPFKNLYNDTFFKGLTNVLSKTLTDFDKKLFLKKIHDEDWEARELKARMKHIAEVLHHFMPTQFDRAVKLIYKTIDAIRSDGNKGALEYMFFPEYIEKYGLDHFDISMEAIEFITQFISCEFAIRPFIIRNKCCNGQSMKVFMCAGCPVKDADHDCPGQWPCLRSRKTRHPFCLYWKT